MIKLETERLVIRPFDKNDGEELYEYLSDAETVKFEPYLTFDRDSACSEAERRAGDEHFLAVCLKDGKLIGNLYFAPEEFESWETGYVFNRAYWGKGYACEALSALIGYTFGEMNIHRIFALCDPLNVRSWRLLERVGMRRESVMLKNVFFFRDENGAPLWKDTYGYAILKSEYDENNAR